MVFHSSPMPTPPPTPEEKLERKSVGELLEKMGDSYTTTAVQVAFKEGYNTAVLDFFKHYARIEGEREELLDSLRDARDFIEDCAPAHGEYVLKRINPIINKYPTPSPTGKVCPQ